MIYDFLFVIAALLHYLYVLLFTGAAILSYGRKKNNGRSVAGKTEPS